MAKFRIFLCVLLALGYEQVRSEEALASLEQKVAALELKAESDVGDAKEKAADALEELKQRASVTRTMGHNEIMDVLNQIDQRFDRLKAQAHRKNIKHCAYLQKNLRNSGLLLISGINACTNDRVDEGYRHVEKVNRYEQQAQAAVNNLKNKLHRCKTHPTPGCLQNVKEEYHIVSSIRLPELLRNIENEQRLIRSVTKTVLDCKTNNAIYSLLQSAQPVLAEFEQCIRNP